VQKLDINIAREEVPIESAFIEERATEIECVTCARCLAAWPSCTGLISTRGVWVKNYYSCSDLRLLRNPSCESSALKRTLNDRFDSADRLCQPELAGKERPSIKRQMEDTRHNSAIRASNQTGRQEKSRIRNRNRAFVIARRGSEGVFIKRAYVARIYAVHSCRWYRAYITLLGLMARRGGRRDARFHGLRQLRGN